MSELESRDGIEPIAIVGMSGRLPGARNIREFWNNLANGVESIDFFTNVVELLEPGLTPEDIADLSYVERFVAENGEQ